MITGTSNSDIIAEEQRIMDLYAPHYRTNSLTNSYPYQLERQRFANWLVSHVRQNATDLSKISVLDVGCGTGEILQHLDEMGFNQLTGLDLSPKMIEQAESHVPTADLVNASIDEYVFTNSRFGLITAAFTVHHLQEPRSFFEMVDRILLPDGWFFLLEYNMASWSRRNLLGRALSLPVVPLRKALKIKNSKALAGLDQIPPLFNSAHQQRTYAELIAAMPHREWYALTQVTHGLWLPRLKHALLGSSPFDRAVTRTLETVEQWILPKGAGHFQWIAGRRLNF